MRDEDIEAAVALLSDGFPDRLPTYWRQGLSRLRDRPVPEGYPRYGYVLADSDRLVGIVLLIFKTEPAGNVARILGNVSSWFVEPAYRGYSNTLLAAAMRLKGVTLFNISPTPSTIGTIEAQGFSRYVDGSIHALAALGRPVRGATIRRVTAGTADALPLLARHAAYGCLCFEVRQGSERLPFAFLPRRLARVRITAAQLAFCPSEAAYVRFAGPLGRRLLRLGFPIVTLDACGPIDGVFGRYFAGRGTKFFRGETPPRAHDVTDTELVVFGP